jgi:hypothetical protein
MNKNTTIYSTNDEMPPRYVSEPCVSYSRRASSDEEVIRSTREEVFRDCMTLEESKRKILEKINRHFHKA